MKAGVDQIGPYRIEEKIGHGGMADVFRAKRVGAEGFERPVALKVLHRKFCEDEEFVEMFRSEAMLAARLAHPVLVPVNDYDVVDGTHYMAMDLLEGETLSELYERFRKKGTDFPRGHALYILEKVLDGLHYAHELAMPDGSPANVVHRDVSPRNIFVTRSGAVRLVDFGIARSSGRVRQTQAGIVKGTIPYMAPEQARAEALDRRADVFAVGVLLHHLLTGEVPLKSERTEAQRRELACGELEPKLKRIHVGIRPIVAKALRPGPEERYETAEEMAAAMLEAKEQLEPDYDPTILAAMVAQAVRRKARKTRRGTAARPARPKPKRPSTKARDRKRKAPALRETRGKDGRIVPPRRLPELEPWDAARMMSMLAALVMLLGLCYTFIPAVV